MRERAQVEETLTGRKGDEETRRNNRKGEERRAAAGGGGENAEERGSEPGRDYWPESMLASPGPTGHHRFPSSYVLCSYRIGGLVFRSVAPLYDGIGCKIFCTDPGQGE